MGLRRPWADEVRVGCLRVRLDVVTGARLKSEAACGRIRQPVEVRNLDG
jgi:hypothetical protein